VQLQINPADAVPIYRQIVRQVIKAIIAGRLAPGEKLSSHRDLAGLLVVAPLTVKKAYDELEREGWIGTRRGRGTFVNDVQPNIDVEAVRQRLRHTARQLLADAALADLPLTELIELLRQLDQETRS